MAIKNLKPRLRSSALKQLTERLKDARRLVEIHEECTGRKRGRRHGYDALNRSAVVLSVAAWEGFIEDLFVDAVEFIAKHVKGPKKIPENVRVAMIAHLYQVGGWSSLNSTTSRAIWSLTGTGWRQQFQEYGLSKIKAINTPSFKNLKKVSNSVIGLHDPASNWRAHRWSPAVYRSKLEDILELRHKIAHGALGNRTVGKAKAREAITIINRLGFWTMRGVRHHAGRLIR